MVVEEKRKCPRYDLFGSVKVEGISSVAGAPIKNFSRGGFCAIFYNFDYEPQATVSVKLQVPSKESVIEVIGDVIWKKQIDDKWYAGLRFKEIDKTDKMDVLDYAYNQWLSDLRSKKIS